VRADSELISVDVTTARLGVLSKEVTVGYPDRIYASLMLRVLRCGLAQRQALSSFTELVEVYHTSLY